MERTTERKRSTNLSDEQKTAVIVDIPSTGRRLPPFRANESLVDDAFSSSDQNAGIVSSSRSSDRLQPRLSWTPPAFFTRDYSNARSQICIVDTDSLQQYLQKDLDMDYMDSIVKYLWWASSSLQPIALHKYYLGGCSIALTDTHDEHEVQKHRTVLIKPLPEYLLSHSVWDSYLCKDDKLYACAIGLLRSHLLLIRTQVDLIVAHENSVVPKEITWQQWSSFSRAALPNCHLESCNHRYWYGLLDEVRLTWIWRLSPETFSISGWNRFTTSQFNSSAYIQEKTKWLLGALIYITIVLTAMQVGLATDRLGSNVAFVRASSGFTIFSIMAPLVILLGVIMTVLLQKLRVFIAKFNFYYGDRARP